MSPKRILLACAAIILAAWNLQAQFTFTHVGSGATGDIITNDPATGSYTFNGGGDDIWSGSDNFDFAHYTVVGDFDMSVRVESVEPVARWTKAGLMVREILVPAARMAFTRACPPDVPTGNGGNGVNDVRFMYRTGVTSNQQGEHEEGSGAPAYPNAWIRLLRSGNTIESYRGTDGTNWFLLGAQNTATWEGGALPATMEFGLAVSRHSSADTIATTEFRNYGPTPVNVVSTPVNQLVSVGQPASFSVSVGSGIASYVAYQWFQGSTAIPGATSPTYTKDSPALTDNGSTISVIVSNKLNGATATVAASLSVMANPQIVSVSSKGDPTAIYITFSRDMDNTTTLNKDNYMVDGGVVVSSATAVNLRTVKLSVTTLSFGSAYQVMVGGVLDAVGKVLSPDPTTVTFSHGANMSAPQGLVLKRYDNIGGGAVNDLRNAAIFPCNPSYTDAAIPTMEYGTDPAHNNNDVTFLNTYGTWIYGVFVPAVSGNYRFGATSDDSSEVYLSTDSTVGSKVLIHSQGGWSPERNYDGRVTGDIYLEAGHGYYLEVLQKEDGGGDHVTVAVQSPGGLVITNGQPGIEAANFASRYAYGCPPQFFFNTLGPVSITHGPADKSVNEGSATQFSVEPDGSAPYTIQWYRNGNAIAGATKFTLSVTGYPSNNLATYYAVVNNDFSTITSSTATLTVNPAIQLVSASSRNDSTGIYVKFNKDVAASAADIAKYSVNGGVTISAATLFAPDTVRLAVSTLSSGSYTVTVQGVGGAAGEPLLPDPSTASFTHFNGTFTADFASLPAGSAIYGSAAIADSNLKITTQANDLNGAFLLNDFTGGHALSKFHITWDSRVASAGTPADGYSFNLGNDLPSGTIGSAEEGIGSGLTISFDTYNNGNNEAPAIDIRVGGQTLVHFMYNVNTGGWAPVVLDVSADGKLYLSYNNVVVATNLATSLHLSPGAKYFFAARTGGLNEDVWIDNLSISAFTPGPIAIAAQPSSVTVNERDAIQWWVATEGSGPQTFQWYSNGVAIAGATGPSLGFTALRYANAAVYTVAASNGFSGAISAPWTFTVVSDLIAPVLASQAVGSATLREATLTYSEPIELLTATNIANYSITNSAGAALAVVSARAISSTQIILTTDLQTSGERYTVVANGVNDRSGGPNAIAANSLAAFTAWVFTPGFALMETYETGGGTTVPLLRTHPTYPYFPRERVFITSFDSREVYPTDSHDNYGGRISAVFVAPTNGNYKFYLANDDDAEVYMASDAIGTGKAPFFSAGCCGTWNNSSAVLPLNAGDRRYMELLWKEGGGGDYGRLSIDANAAVPSSMIGIYGNPDATKLSVVQAPADRTSSPKQFAKFTILATNSARLPQIYVWQRSDGSGGFTNIPGAMGTNNTLTVGPMAEDLSDSGSQFRVTAYTPGSSVTATATLSVVPDEIDPTVVSARVDDRFKKIYVTYSEPMDPDTAGLTEPFSYQLFDPAEGNDSFVDSVTLVSPTEVVLTVSDTGAPLREGTPYRIEVWGDVKDANGRSIAAFPGNSATFTTFVRSRGLVKYEFYENIGGGNLASLFASPKWPNSPDLVYMTNSANFPQTVPDKNDYGLRMSGYFYAPVSGDYVFSIKHDDDGRLQVSTDASAANLVTLIDAPCCHGDFFGGATVAMTAGNYYYFEAIVKEAGGGDYLTVGVKPPGGAATLALDGTYLMLPLETTVAPNAGIAQQPSSVTISENASASFSVAVTNTGSTAPFFQWQVNEGSDYVDVLGANAATYKAPQITLAQNGIRYRAVVYVPGKTLYSSAAIVTVLADTNAPVLLSAASANGTQVGVRFSEGVSVASASEILNYLIDGVAPTAATVRADGKTVVLTPATPVGREFSLVVSNIADVAVTPNTLTNASVVGKYWLDTVVDIGGPNPAGVHFSGKEGEIEIQAGGSDVWGTSDQFTYAYRPVTNDFDVKVRIDRLDYVGNAWAKAGMNVRESTDNNARMVWFYPGPLLGSKQFEGAIRKENGGDVTDFGQPRPNSYFPAWLRLIRVGADFTAYLSPDGTNWNQFGATQNAPQFPAQLLMGVGAVSHIDGTATTAEFAEFGSTSPLLNLEPAGSNMVIRWDGSGQLQYTDSLPSASWTPVPDATSPFTVAKDQAHRYYRVQQVFPMPTP